MKKSMTILAALLLTVSAIAQTFTGGVKGMVVDRQGRFPVKNVTIELPVDGENAISCMSNSDGTFIIEGLKNGMYQMKLTAEGYRPTTVNVTVDDGFIKDMHLISLTQSAIVKEAEDTNFTEFDMDDTGYSDRPTIPFGANDVYNNIVGYGFSAIRFKNRGYDSEQQEVYFSGVKLNDAITGYSPYSLWSGLNEATRSKENTIGMESSAYGLGRFSGTTNITGTPSAVRPGWRFSVLTNSALYRLRLMASYASGELDNGISYAFNASVRAGGNDWIQGVFYRNFAFYGGIEKNWDDLHRLSLTLMAAPGSRGTQNASTQEVYNLMNDNMYNSNWGYQDGKVRNSRVRKTFEPVTTLKYTYTPNENLKLTATALWRTGRNGYTALDWYDASDPRPDYYRNLPSYAYMEDSDFNRLNEGKYNWGIEMWTQRTPEYYKYQHVDWDRLYNVNYHNPDGRSKYALEERHVDQNDLNFAVNADWRIDERFQLFGGLNARINKTENYKIINDLLGGKYYLNVDQFAERDFAANEAKLQNDLDYFLANGEAQKITENGKYGYDYLAQIRDFGGWANGSMTIGRLNVQLGGKIGYNSFWREGLVRKGMFAGLDDNGNEIFYKGQKLTEYDSKGNVISSKGKSDVCSFLTYGVKVAAAYNFANSRVYANVGYFNDAPTFSKSFISPRTRNSIVPNLTTAKTFSADVNYQFSSNFLDFRVSGFYTKTKDGSDVMSFYDDTQHSFTNFAMSGIDQRHMGVELGVKVPLPVQGLSISGVLSLGEYIYTSTPKMTQTIDNSSAVVFDNQPVTYWSGTPIFQKYTDASGQVVYEKDLDGNYITKGKTKHYVPSTPQLATEIALNYRLPSYWFFELNWQYFANSYLSMNPLYRTDMACQGPDKVATAAEIEYMTTQEKFNPASLVNASVGKSWQFQRKYNLGFSLEVKNIFNNKWVKTGGYEQTRLITSSTKDRYYKFDSKYFYMSGVNYMLNIYFRF